MLQLYIFPPCVAEYSFSSKENLHYWEVTKQQCTKYVSLCYKYFYGLGLFPIKSNEMCTYRITLRFGLLLIHNFQIKYLLDRM